MNNPILHYRARRGNRQIPTTNDVQVHMLTEVVWDTSDCQKRTPRSAYQVKGDLSEKGIAYPVTWIMPLSAEDYETLTIGLTTLHEAADDWAMSQNFPLERELHVVIGQWLRIGVIYEGPKFSHAYAEFSQGPHKMRAIFEHLPALEQLRKMS